jgi:hypothetical protein
MKKIIIFLSMSIFITVSCDTIGYNEYTVINECDEAIVISVIRRNGEHKNFTVMAKSNSLFHRSDGGIPPKSPNSIESTFKQITITKNGKVSRKNYVDKTKWEYTDSSDTLRKWYLTVTPEDFE